MTALVSAAFAVYPPWCTGHLDPPAWEVDGARWHQGVVGDLRFVTVNAEDDPAGGDGLGPVTVEVAEFTGMTPAEARALAADLLAAADVAESASR